MSKLHSMISTRPYQAYLTMSLVFLFGMTAAPTFGQQCPTDCPTTYSQIINMDELPNCGDDEGADFIGDIGNANQQTSCLNGTLRCFEFIFQRSDATAPESLSFPIGQGAGCNGETDAINVSINGVCSQVWAGGSNANVTLNFPVGVTEIKLYGCLNSAAFIKICGLCRTPAGCTPVVTCPTITPAPVSCTAIPAAATTVAEFVALGGGAAINNCGQAVTITSNDVYSSPLACADRTLARTYTITIGTYTQTCLVTYPVFAATAAILPTQPDIEVACGAIPTPSTLNFTNSLTGTCAVAGVSASSTFTATPSVCTGGNVTETWSATDDCGNVISTSRIIRVLAAGLPTMTALTSIAVDCGGIPAPSMLNFTNGLTGACAIAGMSALSTFSATPAACTGGTVTETWTAVDPTCNRTLTATRTITVRPASAPIFASAPINITVTCGTPLTPSLLNYSNGLTGDCAISGTSAPSTFSRTPVCGGGVAGETVVETWTAIVCNRTISTSRTITVTLPLATMTAPANITGVCDRLPAATSLSFSNGLTGDCASTGVSALSTFSTIPTCEGTVIETWTATDACGRVLAPVSRTITCNSGLSCATTKVRDANCDGANGAASVALTGGVAASYRWDNNENTAIATQLTQGLHSVTVTTTTGCTTICSVSIGNTKILNGSVVQNNAASCKSANGSATVTATGGAANIRYVWDNGETTATATRLTAGIHEVEVISGTCSKFCSINITTTGENLKMGVCATTDATCGKSNGSVTAGVISGQAGTLYFTWRNAANKIVGTTEKVSNLPAGTYTLTLKDACAEVTCTVSVESSKYGCEDKPEPHFYPNATTCCTYTNGSSKPIEHLSYKAKKHGHVTEITPNIFYYYAKIVAPSSHFTVNVVQTKDVADFKFLGLNSDYIQLWDAGCHKSVKGVCTTEGQGKVSIQGAKVGATYILAVRLDTKSLLNTACKAELPDVTYTLASYINNELVKNSKGSISLKPNWEPAHLNAGKCSKRAPENGMEEETTVNTSLLVQPNPAQSAVAVTFESISMGESLISVANINGATVQTVNYEAQQGENTVSLNISELPAGTYIVTVKTAYQWMTKQLVILR